jgi:hypothetical protein
VYGGMGGMGVTLRILTWQFSVYLAKEYCDTQYAIPCLGTNVSVDTLLGWV